MRREDREFGCPGQETACAGEWQVCREESCPAGEEYAMPPADGEFTSVRQKDEFAGDTGYTEAVTAAAGRQKDKRHRRQLMALMSAAAAAVVLSVSVPGFSMLFSYPVTPALVSEAEDTGNPVGELVSPGLPGMAETTAPAGDTDMTEAPVRPEAPGAAEESLPPGAPDGGAGTAEAVVCPDCGGTGIYCPGDPNFGYDRGNGTGYAGCGGTGYSPCPDIWCHDGIRTCANCLGTGTYEGESCRVCGGDGIDDCEFCGGTGIAECISKDAHEVCLTCGGTGECPE